MEEKRKSGLATAGMVLGIIGTCISFIPLINNISFILGILAIIFGIIEIIKKAGVGKAVAGLVLGIIAIMITISAQKTLSDSIDTFSNQINNSINTIDKATGNSTEEILKNDLVVKIQEFEVTKGTYGNTETKLPVIIKNKTDETKSFNIQIEAVTSDGLRITNDYIYANNLKAGQSQQFETFKLVTSDKVEELKKATFNVVEVSMY